MKKKNKVVEFIKSHKKEIAIAIGLTVAGIGVAWCVPKSANLPKPEFSIGKIRELWMDKQNNGETYINAIVDNLTAADLGRFGEEMMKIDGIGPDTVANVIVGFKK